MCGGGDIFKVAALAAGAYFLGPAMFGGLEGTTALTATGEALAGDALAGAGIEAATGLTAGELAAGAGLTAAETAAGAAFTANATSTALADAGIEAATGLTSSELASGAGLTASEAAAAGAAASQAASAPSGLSSKDVMSGLKTAAQLAPLVALAAAPQMPSGSPTALAPVAEPPSSQAASTPAPNIFKKKMKSLGDPTMTSGTGGVTDLSLGKATILGR